MSTIDQIIPVSIALDQTDASESMVSKEAVKMSYELPPSFEDITTLNELPNAQSAKSLIVNRNSKELSHSTTITEPIESSEESKPTMDQSNRRDRIKNANANSAALLGNVQNIKGGLISDGILVLDSLSLENLNFITHNNKQFTQIFCSGECPGTFCCL